MRVGGRAAPDPQHSTGKGHWGHTPGTDHVENDVRWSWRGKQGPDWRSFHTTLKDLAAFSKGNEKLLMNIKEQKYKN